LYAQLVVFGRLHLPYGIVFHPIPQFRAGDDGPNTACHRSQTEKHPEPRERWVLVAELVDMLAEDLRRSIGGRVTNGCRVLDRLVTEAHPHHFLLHDYR
jgi:hypothetical protein